MTRTNGAVNNRRDVVNIVINRCHQASTRDLLPPILESLTVSVREFAFDSAQKLVESVQLEREWDYRNDELRFSAGCISRVAEAMQLEGFSVVTADYRLYDGLRVRHSVLKSLKGRRRERLSAVAKKLLGQIPVYSKSDAYEFCGNVAACYPQARIAVAVGSKQEASRFGDYLEQRLDEGVDVRHSSRKVSPVVTRVSVSTYHYLPKTERIDILLLPFSFQLLGEDAWHHIMERRPDVGRRYVLIPARRAFDYYDRWRLENIAGDVIVPVSQALVSFTAAFLPMPKMHIDGTTTPQGRQRNLVVGNDVRNRRIAEVATGMLQDAHSTLAGLLSNSCLARFISRKDVRVAVLAESAEQARNLAAYLPQWRLCVARPGALHRLPDNAESRHAIVTTTAAAKHGVEADIVIRGTGTSSPLRRQDFRPVGGDHKRGEVLLVDFEDSYHKVAAKHAQYRRDDYRRCGIRVVSPRNEGIDPIISRIPARETSVLPSRWELPS